MLVLEVGELDFLLGGFEFINGVSSAEVERGSDVIPDSEEFGEAVGLLAAAAAVVRAGHDVGQGGEVLWNFDGF